MKSFGIPLLAAIVLTQAAHGQGAVPAGEFQVNSYTPSNQFSPAVTALEDGSFVVVWQSYGSPSGTGAWSVQGQRFAADGAALGQQLQVSSGSGHHWDPAVAALSSGGFVALWQRFAASSPGASQSTVQARTYTAGGTPLGQFQVSSGTGNHYLSAAAPLGDGFIAVWHGWGSSGTDTSGTSIQGRRYGAGGVALGAQFQVNDYTFGLQTSPAVAVLAGGHFVTAWVSGDSSGSDTSATSIQGQRHAADGEPMGEPFQINSTTYQGQHAPSVTALSGGGFVALWHSFGSGGSDSSLASIQGQRYAADGSPVGGELQVNSTTGGSQARPAVVALSGGGFLAVWDSYGSNGSDASELSIQGQHYAADGRPLGGEFQINAATAGLQSSPAVAALSGGGFVAAWESEVSAGSDSDGSSIQGRRYAAPRFAFSGLGGKCLDVEESDPASGTAVKLYRCTGGENQRWRLDLTALPQPVAGLGGRCLVPGAAPGAGGPRLTIGDCGGPDALWRLAPPAPPTSGPALPDHARPSLLVHHQTGLCADVAGGMVADGTPIQLFPCHGGANQLWRPAAAVCTRDTLGLCLGSERFRVDLAWRSFDDTVGSGRAVPVSTGESGLLWFFEADNWELLIKVLDGCAFNDRLWVFAAATTTVEYTLRVTDTATGTVREYFNPLGNAAAAITDIEAFAACPAGLPARRLGADLPGLVVPAPGPPSPAVGSGSCAASLTRTCLAGRRFAVEATWRDYAGNTGLARVVDPRSPTPRTGADDTSRLFSFFHSENWELLVKVLDACETNDRFWMLAAATTDVEYTLTVTDTETGVTREYFNPLGTAAPALVDTFETCP